METKSYRNLTEIVMCFFRNLLLYTQMQLICLPIDNNMNFHLDKNRK